MTYIIMGKYQGKQEEIDTAEDRKTANYLVGEYQMAFGSAWSVWVEESVPFLPVGLFGNDQ